MDIPVNTNLSNAHEIYVYNIESWDFVKENSLNTMNAGAFSRKRKSPREGGTNFYTFQAYERQGGAKQTAHTFVHSSYPIMIYPE